MGHGTMTDAVQRLVVSGYELVDGVQRKQREGQTLVNGVQRTISFAAPVYTVTITGTGHQNICYLTINGTKYYSKKTLEVEAGTEIVFYAQKKTSSSSGSIKSDAIRLNGTLVNTPNSRESADYKYTHTMTGNISVKLGYESGGDGTYVGPINITEE